jgi:hypothetical protein
MIHTAAGPQPQKTRSRREATDGPLFFFAEPCGLDYIDPSATVLGPADRDSDRIDGAGFCQPISGSLQIVSLVPFERTEQKVVGHR